MNLEKMIALVCFLLTLSSIVSAETVSAATNKEPSKSTNGITKSSKQQTPETEGETLVILGKILRPISDVFGAASVITQENIEQQLIHDIADLVRYQAGITVENSGSRFGLSGFTIRGIGGNRVSTEIDGIPVPDQFSIGSFSNSGRNFVDTDLLQQVEILRGPASSVYGSNAIGGVVSFITKKPIDLLSTTDHDFYLGAKAGYYGVDNSRLISLNSAVAQGSSSWLLNITRRDGQEMDNHSPPSVAKDDQKNEQLSILAKYFWDISDNHQLSISFDYFLKQSTTHIQSLLGKGRFRNTASLLGDDESKRENIALAYDFETNFTWLDGGTVRLYRQNSRTEQLTDETRLSRGTNKQFDRDFFYQQKINGSRFNFYSNNQWGDFYHRMGYGVEWSERRVSERRDGLQTNTDNGSSSQTILSEEFPLRDFPISKVRELGLYLNDEIEISTTGLSVIPALRFDQYRLAPQPDAIYLEDNPTTAVVSISESNLSPKLGLQYQMNSAHRWFLQYFEGFRAPPFEDANIGLDIPLFNIRAIPNPDLKSETSTGYEFGYRYHDNNQQLDLIGFYTQYRDFIQTKVNLGFDAASGRIIFQSQNIDSAKIYGSEIQYAYQSSHWFSQADLLKLSANLFWSQGENQQTQQPLNNINPNHLLLGASWENPDKKWSLALHASFYADKSKVDELDDPELQLFKTSGYAIFDLIANYKWNKSIQLSAAIYNLTDRRYWRWSDVQGLLVNDPLLESLSASGINSSLQLRVFW